MKFRPRLPERYHSGATGSSAFPNHQTGFIFRHVLKRAGWLGLLVTTNADTWPGETGCGNTAAFWPASATGHPVSNVAASVRTPSPPLVLVSSRCPMKSAPWGVMPPVRFLLRHRIRSGSRFEFALEIPDGVSQATWLSLLASPVLS